MDNLSDSEIEEVSFRTTFLQDEIILASDSDSSVCEVANDSIIFLDASGEKLNQYSIKSLTDSGTDEEFDGNWGRINNCSNITKRKLFSSKKISKDAVKSKYMHRKPEGNSDTGLIPYSQRERVIETKLEDKAQSLDVKYEDVLLESAVPSDTTEPSDHVLSDQKSMFLGINEKVTTNLKIKTPSSLPRLLSSDKKHTKTFKDAKHSQSETPSGSNSSIDSSLNEVKKCSSEYVLKFSSISKYDCDPKTLEKKPAEIALHDNTIDLITPETSSHVSAVANSMVRQDISHALYTESPNGFHEVLISRKQENEESSDESNNSTDFEDDVFASKNFSVSQNSCSSDNIASKVQSLDKFTNSGNESNNCGVANDDTDSKDTFNAKKETLPVADKCRKLVEDGSTNEGLQNAAFHQSCGSEDDVFYTDQENKNYPPKKRKEHLDRNTVVVPVSTCSQENAPGTSWRSSNCNPQFSDSDSDDQFENFLFKMKAMTEEKVSKRTHITLDDKDFINDESLESDDEAFHHTVNRRLCSTDVKVLLKNKVSANFGDVDFKVERSPCKVLFESSNMVSPVAPVFLTPDGNENSYVTPKKLNLCDSDNSDMFSDKKNVQSLIKTKRPSSKICKENKAEFLYSLSADMSSRLVCQEARPFIKHFQKRKGELVSLLYSTFNECVFHNELPKTMEITWKPRLTKTAGLCHCVRSVVAKNGRNARIDLSSKVIDSPVRLRDTLLHEMCHAATWIIYGYQDGHGKLWKYWAQEAIRVFPKLPQPTVCHNYVINTRYTYKCVLCGSCVGRHSKSLNTTAKKCGRCGGKFELMTNYSSASKTPRTPSRFALYVKENYGSIKKSNQKSKHGEIMRILSADFTSKAKIS